MVVADNDRRERAALGVGDLDIIGFDDQITDGQHKSFVADDDAGALPFVTQSGRAARVGDCDSG